MTDALRVILEVGKMRKVVAAAYEWPGLDRWATSEDDALAKLASYLPRYVPSVTAYLRRMVFERLFPIFARREAKAAPDDLLPSLVGQAHGASLLD